MSGKKQFEKIKKEMPYILKDGKFYVIKFYDEEKDCCHYRLTDKHKGKREENIPSYEEACKLYNIELEDTVPTPDRYFLKKVDEPSNSNIIRTVSDKMLINYLSEHKEDCPEVIEKLKEIVRTHKNVKVRKAAYETCITLEIEGTNDLREYIKKPEIKEKETETEPIEKVKKQRSIPNRTTPLDKEKAILVYISLVRRYKEHREKIICSVFMKDWIDMFECDKYNRSKEDKQTIREKQIAAFAFVKDELDSKSYEEIIAFRDTFMICSNREVPVELKQLAQSKGVIVSLAENITKNLSGFDVLLKVNKCMTYRINDVPFGLSEDEVKRFLESLPTSKELAKQEKELVRILSDDSIPVKDKKEAVNKYKAPYATHEFKKFMNRFTTYTCKNQQLTLFCVNLCKRVGINNLSNELPIEYKFCVGSGKRKQTMKRINNRRKGNKKVARKRKER